MTALAAVQALGDGASRIWKSVGRVLPGCSETLDIYHASERVGRCAQTIFGEGTAEATAAFERGRDLLVKDGWSGVCAWVAELLAIEKTEERERRHKATEKLLGYFAKHTNRLNYQERPASGRGPSQDVGLRLKPRGARWRKKNVRPVVSLVCVRHSVQWEAYWTLVA